MSHVKQELPWVTAVYIDAMDDDLERFSQDKPSAKQKPKKLIKATIFVEKDTHRRIIIGRHGQIIKAIGTEARKELEKILGEKVFLDLWVKVKEKWRDKADVLDLIESQ